MAFSIFFMTKDMQLSDSPGFLPFLAYTLTRKRDFLLFSEGKVQEWLFLVSLACGTHLLIVNLSLWTRDHEWGQSHMTVSVIAEVENNNWKPHFNYKARERNNFLKCKKNITRREERVRIKIANVLYYRYLGWRLFKLKWGFEIGYI